MSVSNVSSSYNYYNYLSTTTVKSSSADEAASKKDSINQLVKDYTYTSKGVFQPTLDKNDDSVWDKSELQNYADALKKATGRTIDVDDLIKKYGNEDGKIDNKSQSEIVKNDVLQLSGLQTDWIKANTNTTSSSSTTTNANSAVTNSISTEDLLGRMSPAGKSAFSKAMQRAEAQQSLLSGFGAFGGNSDMLSLMNSQSNLMMYAMTLRAGSNNSDFHASILGQLMNSIG